MRPEFELGNKYFFFVTSFSFQLFGKNIVWKIEKGTLCKMRNHSCGAFAF